MDGAEARAFFAGGQIAMLATVGGDGRPHLCPVTFVVLDDGHDGVIASAVDHKPQRTSNQRPLVDIPAAPRVTLLVDHCADDWSTLSWARADAVAEVLPGDGRLAGRDDDDPRRDLALDALVEKYPQYRERRPVGPVVWATVTGWSGWYAAG